MAHTTHIGIKCLKLDCPLNMSCSRIPAEVRKSEFHEGNVDVLIVSDYPSMEDTLARTPFTSSEGQIVKNLLKQELDEGAYAVSYLIRGWPIEKNSLPANLQNEYITRLNQRTLNYVRTLPMNSHPEKEKIKEYCISNLQYDIQILQPKKIIVMGGFVAEALFPTEPRGINALYSEFGLKYQGMPVRFISSPTSILRAPASRSSWERNFRLLLYDKKLEYDKYGGEYRTLKSLPEIHEYIEYLKEQETDVAVDCETANLGKKYGNKMATIQFCDNAEGSVVIPIHHHESPLTPDELKKVILLLHGLFANRSKIKSWVGHNISFDNHQCITTFGTPILSAPMFDTQIAVFLIDENRAERVTEFKYGIYSLKQVAYDYLMFDGYSKEILKVRDEGSLADLPLEQLAEYGAMDVFVSRKLRLKLIEEAKKQNYQYQLMNLMYNLYNPMIHVFCEIEQNGFPVSVEHLRTLNSPRSPLTQAINVINEQLKSEPAVIKANDLLQIQTSVTARFIQPVLQRPWLFSFAKKGHPQKLFFDIIGLQPIGDPGKSGAYSVDEEFQDAYKSKNLLVTKFADWVELNKMHDSFAKALYNYISPVKGVPDCNIDKRIRASFRLSKVVTGRVACTTPNLQALPRAETEPKKAIKNIFQATKDHLLIQFDFKANEMRWVTILAKEKGLAESFIRSKRIFDEYKLNPTPEGLKKAEMYGDPHRNNASLAFNVSIEEVTKYQRQAAKGISFGLLYDSSHKSVSEQYNIPLDDVVRMFDVFFQNNPNIKAWKDEMKHNAAKYSFVETPHGRRRRFPIFDLFRDQNGNFIQSKVPPMMNSRIAESLRQSSNSPVQGAASDAAYLGVYQMLLDIRKNKRDWKLVNAVHDSVVMEIPKQELTEAMFITEECLTTRTMDFMSNAFDIEFICPIEVDGDFGVAWGELEKWDYTAHQCNEYIKSINGK